MSAGDPLPDGSHGPHVLVDDLDALDVCADDRHHLDRVLRVRAGDPVTIGDGRGGWQPFHWGPMRRWGSAVRLPPRPLESAWHLH
ncbi:MAG: RNA methyltransferase PUA domain-containing protein [Acidimicrobiales bacterium]